MKQNPKIKTLPQLTKICQQLHHQNKTIGLITGCFDILHIGHVRLFRFAKIYVDILIVGLENDQTIKLAKGANRPIFPFRYRGGWLLNYQVLIMFSKSVGSTHTILSKPSQFIS